MVIAHDSGDEDESDTPKMRGGFKGKRGGRPEKGGRPPMEDKEE